MEKFDYIILTETNFWIGTGTQATQKELEQDLKYIKEHGLEGNELPKDTKLIVYKADKMESYSI